MECYENGMTRMSCPCHTVCNDNSWKNMPQAPVASVVPFYLEILVEVCGLQEYVKMVCPCCTDNVENNTTSTTCPYRTVLLGNSW